MTWNLSSKRSTELDRDIDPLRILLATAVDHAGLFPPAGLNMSAAVATFHEHRSGEHAWMLGSFVLPAGRLPELAKTRAAGAAAADDPWPLSLIVASAEEGAEALQLVRRRLAEGLRVAAFEVRPGDARTIRDKHEHLSGPDFEGVHVYYEVPLDGGTEARLDAVAAVGAHAKLRTGGVTAEAFPSGREIVRFMRACAERDLAFKATAGLHHAFAGSYPLTYDEGSACAGMYGFLSLALTAGLIRTRAVDDDGAVASLFEGPHGLEVLGDGLAWHGHRFSRDDLVDLRRDFFRSFGSCSFAEPVEELREAGLLGSDRSHAPR
jgi:hypothetical protein